MTTPKLGTRIVGTVAPCAALGPTSAEISEANAERRRYGFAQFLERNQLTPTELARAIGLPSANLFFNFAAGRSKSLSSRTLQRILDRFPHESFDALVGKIVAPVEPVERATRTVRQAFEACAGVWRSRRELQARHRQAVPIPEGFPHPGPRGFGVQVGSQGAELLYRADTLLVCAPLRTDEGALLTGARVILWREANRGRKIEITVREIVQDGEHAWLWPRSSLAAHQTPIRTPWPITGTFPADRRTTATILGRVIASWQPEPGATAT